MQAAHLPAISQNPEASLVACVDTDNVRGKIVQKKYDIPKFYEQYEEMFYNENPDIVLVAVPHKLHASVTIKALEAGINVFVEKPMATSLELAAKIVETSMKKERMVVVGHEMRLLKSVQFGKKLVDGGRLGKTHYCRILHLRRKGIPNSPTFLSKELAVGGPVFDIGSHSIDAAMFMMNFPKPLSALGRTYSVFPDRLEMRSDYPRTFDGYSAPVEVEDFGAGMVDFDNGAVMHLEASWASYIKEDKNEITLMGNKGGVHFENGSLHYMTTIEKEFVVANSLTDSRAPLASEYQEFWSLVLNAVSKKYKQAPYPLCTVQQGMMGVAIMDGVYKSASMGRPVEVKIPESAAITSGAEWSA